MSIANSTQYEPSPLFLDPVTYDVMRDPVVCDDGRTYDRSTARKLDTSPFTRKPLHILTDNIDVRGAIFEAYPEHAAAYRELNRQALTAIAPPAPQETQDIAGRAETLSSTFIALGEDSYRDKRGGVYTGNIQNGLPHGFGTYYYPSGGKYIGSFSRGQFHGRGQLTYDDGSIYDGDFVMGSGTGHATVTWPDGVTYQGDYVAGKRHGLGTLTCPEDDCTYEGPFVDGQMQGRGIETRGSAQYRVVYFAGKLVEEVPL